MNLYDFLPVAVTSQPRNESELQLYRVLQRANLLSYYDTFIAQGGDDVHQVITQKNLGIFYIFFKCKHIKHQIIFSYVVPQLCEAGEEEFLEIMALVGMASKPLHVRRLQKALQDWVQNPGMSGKTSFLGQASDYLSD